ncbi:nuclear pore complex protein NUP1-like isoform X3 [Cornus florida]|uniref:nuclear pore complex protein NUP1-like isoform X3 n=1 Tax=Cornus florida TaxID=4283 RepID=UPI00289B8CDE|nr:nuclear pore complex protein NUP1-like isoform X3 [Cornus florida]
MQHMSDQGMPHNTGMNDFPGRTDSFSAKQEHPYISSKTEGQWQQDRDAPKVSNPMMSHMYNEGFIARLSMVAAGEGTSSYRGGGETGGKFRKKPLRRPQTTPYNRPPTALGNPRDGWLSKLVDPASKLISASAQMFFSSVFRKRLLPPPHPHQGQTKNQGTRFRSEIDRLTEVLHSRSVDLPVGNENRKTEANLPKPPSAFERKGEFANSPMLKTGTENCRLHGGLSTPIVSSRVLEEDVASPAELAKAYMGSRPSKATTPTLALRSQAPREDATLLNNIQFSPKSSIMSLAPKSALRLGVTENGFITPRSRGRSAIYDMARTPYSRVYSTANQKGVKSISDGFGEPSSSSQYAWEQDGYVGSKQVAHKRRSCLR